MADAAASQRRRLELVANAIYHAEYSEEYTMSEDERATYEAMAEAAIATVVPPTLREAAEIARDITATIVMSGQYEYGFIDGCNKCADAIIAAIEGAGR